MRKPAALLVTILFASSLLTLSSTANASRTVIVPDDYATITSAIGNASDGDIILVRAGTYNEIQLKTNKTVSLIGEGASKTKISLNPPIINWSILYQTFSGYANPIEIYADNVVISGFTIESTGGNIFIKGNHERLTGNIIDVNVALGGDYQVVTNNTLTLTLDPILGIQIGGSYSTICQNTGSGDIGIGDGSYNNVFANDIVGEIGGFGTSTSNLFYGNSVRDGYGVVAGRNDIVASNGITNCTHGVYIPNGFDNLIYGNTIMNNRGAGLAKIEGLNNTFYANYVANNEIGVQIGATGTTFGMGNTTLYNNDFMNNNQQVQVLVPTPTEYWDYNGKGNFWSDYTGTDADGDGIGDSPYSVGSNESDRYPLVSPIDISSISVQLPSWANLSIPSSLPAPFFPPLPKSAPSPTSIPAPTGSFDNNAEFKSGMIPEATVKFWYVWINTSGTQVIYYAMLSDVYNPPIINFFGQHFKTADGTDVFVGSTKALLEVYDDKNGDGIPQADFTIGQSEILYHLIVNSSVSYETKPLEKTVEDGVPHYRWGITYKTIDGFLFKADQTGFAFKVNIDYLRFEYDFYITGNESYTKTTFGISDLTSHEQANTGPLPSLEGLSLSLLYITSVASPKPYSPYVNGQPYDSATA
ncbi:MAG TPA: NosD domain-containing protein, partial [Candidatus Bathyarchaeia archaeon]